jgi:hypothetical protein
VSTDRFCAAARSPAEAARLDVRPKSVINWLTVTAEARRLETLDVGRAPAAMVAFSGDPAPVRLPLSMG